LKRSIKSKNKKFKKENNSCYLPFDRPFMEN
jgi:hypothetical protein